MCIRDSRETCHDLKPMYKSESRIIKEYEIMIRKLKIHIPVGQVLSEFAENVEQEDVDNFVTVFTTAQKSGGDSIVIIKDAVKVISEKMETEKEIQTMIASKKLEFEIMSMIPFGMIGYMKLTFGDFLKVLYGNPAGIIVMSICLALYFIIRPQDQKEVQRMKKYEVMYIVRPNVEEEARKALIEEMNTVFVTKNSTVDSVKEWGMRELAYEIKGETKGYYVLLNVTATPEAVKEFERIANIKENIIRYITVAE